MRRTNTFILLFVFTSLILSISLQNGYSLISVDTICKEGKVLVFRTNAQKHACVFDSTASIWETRGI